MDTVVKKFDQDLFDKYDDKARIAAKKFITKTHPELKVISNSNKYGVDLLLYNNDKLVGEVEVEIKTSWTEKTVPKTFKGVINVPSRKYKILNKNSTHYFLFNADCSSVLVAKGQDIIKCPKKEVCNRYVSRGELFYKVPIITVLKYRKVN